MLKVFVGQQGIPIVEGHPEVIAHNVRELAQQVNLGKNIEVSTNSDFFIKELNICVLLSNPNGMYSKGVQELLGQGVYTKDMALSPDLVELYEVARDGTPNKVELVDGHYCIGSFDRVIENQNNSMDTLLWVKEDEND